MLQFLLPIIIARESEVKVDLHVPRATKRLGRSSRTLRLLLHAIAALLIRTVWRSEHTLCGVGTPHAHLLRLFSHYVLLLLVALLIEFQMVDVDVGGLFIELAARRSTSALVAIGRLCEQTGRLG